MTTSSVNQAIKEQIIKELRDNYPFLQRQLKRILRVIREEKKWG